MEHLKIGFIGLGQRGAVLLTNVLNNFPDVDIVAVCDGYTGAYNLLLKLEGINCYTQTGSEHAWTVAVLDGTEYHIDTTWGDSSIIFANELYFAMSPALSYGFHPW